MARERNAGLGELERSGSSDLQDAERLARLTNGVHQQPGLLRSILGGGSETQGQQAGLLGHPLAKAALAGIAAMDQESAARYDGDWSRIGNWIDNPCQQT